MFRFRDYLRRNFIQLPCAFTRLTELIIIKTFINIWHLFQPFIAWRNILPFIRKVEWVLAVSQKDIYMLCSYTWGFQITLKKKSHNDMTSYCQQHIVCNYGGGGGAENLKFHSPLSWQQLLNYFVLCLCLFLLWSVQKVEELTPIYIFYHRHKNVGLESAFVRKLLYCFLTSFFFSLFFISLGAKEQGKGSSVLSLQLPSITALWRWRTNNYMVVVGSFDWAAG